MSTYRKKLIEVAMPLDAINRASVREKSIRHGHPSTLHVWWSRKPLATCRAVLFGQLVDDPSAWPDRFPTEEIQDKERGRLFRIIEDLVIWENSESKPILEAARLEIARSLAYARLSEGDGDQRDEAVIRKDVTPPVVQSYLAEVAPPVYDPFAGGGSIPVEAQRLGLGAIASDLNPIAVVVNKALIEIPPRFSGIEPIGPQSETANDAKLVPKVWLGTSGLAEDVRRYGEWMQAEAFRKLGHYYPQVKVPSHQGGGQATVIAWIWVRTVESPNPAFRGVHVPLASDYFLSTKKGKEAWVEPVLEGRTFRFEVRSGTPKDPAKIKTGTKAGRATFSCLFSGAPMTGEYIDAEGQAGRMSERLMAVVVKGERGRIFIPATTEMEELAQEANPPWSPEEECRGTFASNAQGRRYCFNTFGDYFTDRQLLALTTFSDLISAARGKAIEDARTSGWGDDGQALDDGGSGPTAYGDAIATYLSFAIDRMANTLCTIARWTPQREQTVTAFARQGIPMTWMFPEVNPFAGAAGDFVVSVKGAVDGIAGVCASGSGRAFQANAADAAELPKSVISTDPPYYDNIGYADLSDFFYVWLRRCLRDIYPQSFSTVLVPKSEEIFASPYRHGGREAADAFFLREMKKAIGGILEQQCEGIPATIYYAFKQSESRGGSTASTGWETFLEALLQAGFSITGTWPLRTELSNRMVGARTNALASAIVLVCRKRSEVSPTVAKGDFRRLLRQELPQALSALQKGNIAPVDLAQGSIGPGMAIFSRHERVLESDGSAMSVRSALEMIHEITDEVLGQEEGDFDKETRFAVTWFETHGFEEGPYGEGETLATARAVSVTGVQEAGVLRSAAGKIRLYSRAELPHDWDPETDDRLTVWEATQHLIKRLNEDGEQAAAALLARLGSAAEQARNLAYRLYITSERNAWIDEAQAYNGLVLAWPELEKLAGESGQQGAAGPQAELFE